MQDASNPVTLFHKREPIAGVTPFELERYFVGELSAARRAEIESALAEQPALKAALEAIEAEQRAFVAEMPFGRFAARHAQRKVETEGMPARLTRWLARFRLQAGGLVLGGAAAAVLFAVAPSSDDVPEVTASGGEVASSNARLKGAARLGIFVKEPAGARLGRDGERLSVGDRIQFVVKDVRDKPSMVIVGIDGRGQVSVYAQSGERGLTQKGPAASHESPRVLPQSVVLDDSLGPERFFVVFGGSSPEKLRADVERAAAQVAGSADLTVLERLPLSDDVVQSSVHIVKIPEPTSE